ncbi:MAG: DUF4412 domain-containing protein [Bacteroidota bacterium]|nr:DUF4412 domain-containing protein [Bacteroidota bacterium]
MKNILIPFSLCVFLFSFSGSLFAGWIIHERNFDSESKDKYQYTYYLQEQKLRLEEKGFVSIFDLNDYTITFINSSKSIYWKGSVDSYLSELRDAVKAEMIKDITGRSKEEQEMIKATYEYYISSLKDTLDNTQSSYKVELVNTGEKEKIAGISASGYGLFINKIMKEEVWVSDEVHIEREMDLMKLNALLDEIGAELPGVLSRQADPKYAQLRKKGLMMKTIEYDFESSFTTEVYKLKQKDLDIQLFLPPKDYKEADLSELGLY